MSLPGMAVLASTESIPVDEEWQADKWVTLFSLDCKGAYNL
jgi:hypothetical protein